MHKESKVSNVIPMLSGLPLDSVFFEEPEDQYHAQAGVCLSSHLLSTFRHCPLLYKQTVDKVHTRPDSPAFALGRAVHALILEGEDIYLTRYRSDSPVNPKTGEPYGILTKRYKEWASEVRASGRDAISKGDEITAQLLMRSVVSHKNAMELLDGAPYRERVARVDCMGRKCQARVDAFGSEAGIVDLKTCQTLDKLVYQARSFNYIEQLSFYRMVLREVGVEVPRTHLIGVEKDYPYRCGVWRVEESSLDVAEEGNRHAIDDIMECEREGRWPTNYEDVRLLSI